MANRESVVDMLTHVRQEQDLMKSFRSFVTDENKHLDRFKELITGYNQLRAKYEQRGGEAVVGLIASVDASIEQIRALIREVEAQPAKETAMETRLASLVVRVRPAVQDFVGALGDDDEKCQTVREVKAFATLFKLTKGFPGKIVCTTKESYAAALSFDLKAVFEQPQQSEQPEQPQRAESPTGEPSLKYPKYDTGNWRQTKD